MTEIEKAQAAWRTCANAAIFLSGPDRAQITNSFKAMIEKAEQAEGFEAFKRDVSDAVEAFFEASGFDATKGLIRFILPKPVDPLVEAWDEAWVELSDKPAKLETFRAALAKRGGKIVWENEP